MPRIAPAARPFVQRLRTGGGRLAAGAVAAFRPAAAATTTPTLPPPQPLLSYVSARHATAPFTTSSRRWNDAPTSSTYNTTATTIPPPESLEGWELDPDQTTLPWAEKELMRRGTPPVGSRRRRAALQTMTALSAATGAAGPVPFELMPYQCFQEARKVLQADRDEKLRQIATEMNKIRRLETVLAGDAAAITSRGGAPYLQKRLASLRQHVERLKILADINDPLVKRRFEDGLGDMNKPIYRYLAEQRWRGRPLRLMEQRITQFHLAPDLFPAPRLLPPRADVELYFRSYHVPPGAVVDSLISEVCPRLRVQVFDRGHRLVTVAVVDADVPDLANDTFARRCHFLAANVPLAPTAPSLPLGRLDAASQVVLPWLPAFAQKGSPPHRLAVFHGLTPVATTLFRTQWDAGTAGVMERAGVPGADIELRPTRLPSLKPPRKARGWEAKRQGPKFRHLWKYTHRIATPRRKFVR
ncbi:mitochondrial large ribosomal subunit [Niveomyces insectorum RCEF 264]|uniref:Mitochondrial large ribosomal subunit n=1 Tax=Niveomyces insectorum RCEF 264 TaxID=1081102 RepID=A0A167YYU4_9HYPO|nr:mitochondrial large ribosomal subunit [Niveomyces insectorum RCEF 264]